MEILLIILAVITYVVLAGVFATVFGFTFKRYNDDLVIESIFSIIWPVSVAAILIYLFMRYPIKYTIGLPFTFGRWLAKKLMQLFSFLKEKINNLIIEIDERYDIRK